ncbi:MAG: helix-turn-helix transcriptional regulator [Spirochaetaceae bacterium]|jgi:DNA-binding CsgD family transcriptional regulator|nr:helix-turn-helix transcriptional regulator [Spirochaetaceae bacterium]
MTELHPNILFEITRAAVSIGGWFVLFFLLDPPRTRLRQVALLVSMPICYTAFMIIPLSDTGNVILWTFIILLFALLQGKLRTSFWTALYYIGIEAAIDSIRHFFVMYFLAKPFRGYTPEYYIQFNLQYLVVLGWTLFYYWIMKNRSWKMPTRFWIMTALPPFGMEVLLTRYADSARAALAAGVNIYLDGILIGLFLLVLNFFTFYLYIKLSTAYEAKVFANKASNIPPVYTREAGFSAAFIEKYGISAREQDIVKAVMQGKSNKEIANTVFVSPKTVEFHLRSVYKKTGVPNRFALYVLIKDDDA